MSWARSRLVIPTSMMTGTRKSIGSRQKKFWTLKRGPSSTFHKTAEAKERGRSVEIAVTHNWEGVASEPVIRVTRQRKTNGYCFRLRSALMLPAPTTANSLRCRTANQVSFVIVSASPGRGASWDRDDSGTSSNWRVTPVTSAVSIACPAIRNSYEETILTRIVRRVQRIASLRSPAYWKTGVSRRTYYQIKSFALETLDATNRFP